MVDVCDLIPPFIYGDIAIRADDSNEPLARAVEKMRSSQPARSTTLPAGTQYLT